MKIYIANNATALNTVAPNATVEAEFGDSVVTGSILTLAHHGPRSGRPCPCSLPNFQNLGIETVGISHVDLDTLGGLMAIMGQKPDQYDWVKNFWAVAAQVDVMGVHKLPQISLGGVAEDYVLDSLNAFWAFSESPEGRVYPPRDGSVAKIDLNRHFEVLKTLLVPKWEPCRGGIDNHEHQVYCGCPDWEGQETWWSDERRTLVEAGRRWAAAKEALAEDSYSGTVGKEVLLRVSEQFVNHLYTHDRRPHKAVVGFNPIRGTVTVSLADPVEGVSCGDFVKSLWGPEAGGHSGIGGSPRGRVLTLDDARAAALALAEKFK